MKKFDKLFYKHMFEKKTINAANKKEVGKRVEQEIMSYIDKRKDDMPSADYEKIQQKVNKLINTLNPETIFDDLITIGEIVGLKDSYSRMVGKVMTIVDELENKETSKTDILGEPKAEEEPAPEEPNPDEEISSKDNEEKAELPKKKNKKKDSEEEEEEDKFDFDFGD